MQTKYRSGAFPPARFRGDPRASFTHGAVACENPALLLMCGDRVVR